VCTKSGPKLTIPSEILFRQVRAQHWDGEILAREAFLLNKGDDHCLSVDRSSITTAAASFVLQTTPKPVGFERKSVGVWGVSVEEVDRVGLDAWKDAVLQQVDAPANPAHAVIEMGSDKAKRDIAIDDLVVFATKRGCLHS
jgi:hypothetical protein